MSARRPMRRASPLTSSTRLVGLSLVVAAVAYVAYPYATVYVIWQGAKNHDRALLDTFVDWDSVRGGLKRDLNAVVEKRIDERYGEDASGPLSGPALARTFMSRLIDRKLNLYVSPRGLGRVLNKGANVGLLDQEIEQTTSQRRQSREGQSVERPPVRFAFFTSPRVFRVELGAADESADAPVVAVLHLRGVTWRLSRLMVPTGHFSEERKPESTQAQP